LPIQDVLEPPEFDEAPPPDEVEPAVEAAEPLSPPPRGTAEPTLSPFEGREGSLCCGRPRSSCAHADARLNVSAAAANPTDNL